MKYFTRKNRCRFLFAGAVVACLAFFPAMLCAQQMLTDRTSTAEEVAFTFYKLSKTKPDFKRWADNTDIPRSVTVAEYPAYRRLLLRRLISLYNAYDPEKSLTVRVRANISLRARPKYSLEGTSFAPGVEISLGDDKKTPYFPYRVADQWVSVVVKDLQRVLSINLSEDSLGRFKHAFRLLGAGERPVTIMIRLKPLSADATAPMHLNGIDQWLLLTEIINASLWNAEGELVWEIQDRNYVSPEQKEIEDLFRE